MLLVCMVMCFVYAVHYNANRECYRITLRSLLLVKKKQPNYASKKEIVVPLLKMFQIYYRVQLQI